MSLFILDTDTLSLLQHNHPKVRQRVQGVAPTDLAITIITVEEQLTGWLTLLRQARQPDEIARVYERMTQTVQALASLQILPFTEAGIQRYNVLQTLKLNIGKMDLRIGAIALENNGIIVSRNHRDFGRIPGLTVEDWAV